MDKGELRGQAATILLYYAPQNNTSYKYRITGLSDTYTLSIYAIYMQMSEQSFKIKHVQSKRNK